MSLLRRDGSEEQQRRIFFARFRLSGLRSHADVKKLWSVHAHPF